jgi:hypothetical protein
VPESIRINFVTGAPRRYLPDVEALATMPARLEAALAGRPAGSMRTTAADGGPSVAQTIGRMIEHAQLTQENLYRMAWMTDPIVKTPDLETSNERHSWEAREPDRLLTWFTEAVGQSVDLLKELPDSSWGRPGQSPELGRRSIRQTVREAVAYYEAQVARIEAGRE